MSDELDPDVWVTGASSTRTGRSALQVTDQRGRSVWILFSKGETADPDVALTVARARFDLLDRIHAGAVAARTPADTDQAEQ